MKFTSLDALDLGGISSKSRITVLTGAGISQESGIATFRGAKGLWENHAIEDVATPQAWVKNPELVLRFYNERRAQVINARPNLAHKLLAQLDNDYDVQIITQNVDDLHERAGSHNILHLHGEIVKARSSVNENLIYPISGSVLNLGDKCAHGAQLRPHIVWFGEMVPEFEKAIALTHQSDLLLIIGTSLQVYPAASLVKEVGLEIPVIIVDPEMPRLNSWTHWCFIPKKATEGMEILSAKLMRQ